MNLNELAVEISRREGKKIQVNIAQIKEIVRCLHDILVEESEARQKAVKRVYKDLRKKNLSKKQKKR